MKYYLFSTRHRKNLSKAALKFQQTEKGKE